MYVHAYVLYKHMHMYDCMYFLHVCMCVCINVFMHVYMYTVCPYAGIYMYLSEHLYSAYVPGFPTIAS